MSTSGSMVFVVWKSLAAASWFEAKLERDTGRDEMMVERESRNSRTLPFSGHFMSKKRARSSVCANAPFWGRIRQFLGEQGPGRPLVLVPFLDSGEFLSSGCRGICGSGAWGGTREVTPEPFRLDGVFETEGKYSPVEASSIELWNTRREDIVERSAGDGHSSSVQGVHNKNRQGARGPITCKISYTKIT